MNYQREIAEVFRGRWAAMEPLELPRHPGVYLISYPGTEAGTPIRPNQIYYVGMTVSTGGLRSRINQFLRALRGYRGHSGGRRFHRLSPSQLPMRIAFRSYPVEVRKSLRTASDLEQMGHIACLEYFLLSYLLAHCNREPELNWK